MRGIGRAIGALSHYRFIAVIGVGFLVLLSLPAGRRALLDPRVWIAIAFGAAAWTPLMAWNMDNAEAGLRFQLVDRHPWAFHADGLLFIAIQGLRSEEHTSELQSLMRISYAVFCLKQKNKIT